MNKSTFLILSILFISASLSGQISGRVTDASTGQALTDAHVTVKHANVGAVTNADGWFELTGLERGRYQLVVSFLGFQPAQKSVTITDNQPVEIEFLLEPSPLSERELVVTATRSERSTRDIPFRIQTIGSRRIESQPLNNIEDILQLVSGVAVERSFGIQSSRSSVSLRGLGAREQSRTLILIDGIPMNKSDGGTVNWNIIQPADIERVEVVKGPGSALYGGHAMGGIINIITKRPAERFAGSVTASTASYNTFGSRFNVSGRPIAGSGFYAGLSGFYRASDGYISEAIEDVNEHTIPSFLEENMLRLNAGYEFENGHNIDLSILRYDDERGTGTMIQTARGAYNEHDAWQYRLRYEGMAGETRLSSGAYLIDESYGAINESIRNEEYTRFDVSSTRLDMGAYFFAARPVGGNNTITAGADFRLGEVDGADVYRTSTDVVINQGKLRVASLFLQNEWSSNDERFMAIAGIRYDNFQFFDGLFLLQDPTSATNFMAQYQDTLQDASFSAFSPRLSLQYRINENVRTFISAGKGFRPPVLDDMCRSGRMALGFKVANPNLKPENLYSIEWGGDVSFGKGFTFSPTVYYSQGNDFIYFLSTGDSVRIGNRWRPILLRDNITQVEVAGIETEARWNPNANLLLQASYTYNHTRILENEIRNPAVDQDLEGKQLAFVPTHMASAGVTWYNRFVNTSLTAVYRSEFFEDDHNENQRGAFFIVNARAWRTLLDNFVLSLTAMNLADTIYTDTRGLRSPGRFMTFDVSYNF